MSKFVSAHLIRISGKRKDIVQNRPELESILQAQYTPEGFLSRIYVFRARDLEEQNKAINLLPNFLTTHPLIKLICIDSIAFHYRYGTWALQDITLRNKQLATIATKLNTIAYQHNIAIVISNQLTTKFLSDNPNIHHHSVSEYQISTTSISSSTSRLVPALGDIWSQISATRIHLHWDTRITSKYCGQRLAYISKNGYLQFPYYAYYIINSEGIRGLKSSSSRRSHTQNHKPIDNNNNNNNNTTNTIASSTNVVSNEEVNNNNNNMNTE